MVNEIKNSTRLLLVGVSRRVPSGMPQFCANKKVHPHNWVVVTYSEFKYDVIYMLLVRVSDGLDTKVPELTLNENIEQRT